MGATHITVDNSYAEPGTIRYLAKGDMVRFAQHGSSYTNCARVAAVGDLSLKVIGHNGRVRFINPNLVVEAWYQPEI